MLMASQTAAVGKEVLSALGIGCLGDFVRPGRVNERLAGSQQVFRNRPDLDFFELLGVIRLLHRFAESVALGLFLRQQMVVQPKEPRHPRLWLVVLGIANPVVDKLLRDRKSTR